jgi:hypothetical protein
VSPGDGFRAEEHPGARVATFCRLEHVVPWAMRRADWQGGVSVTRHRGEHRIHDEFASVGDFADWAKAGGRWR